MKARHGVLVATVAALGLVSCAVAFAVFVRKILTNGLSLNGDLSPRDFYLAAGRYYSSGFFTGFFFCFFLVLAAVAMAGLLARSRRPRSVDRYRGLGSVVLFRDRGKSA